MSHTAFCSMSNQPRAAATPTSTGTASSTRRKAPRRITTYGSAPAVVIGSATQDMAIGEVPSSNYGVVNCGTISAFGVYDGVGATAVSVGGLGHAVNVANGITNFGTITAKAVNGNATAIHIGSGTTSPGIVNAGSIIADGAGASGTSAQALFDRCRIDGAASLQLWHDRCDPFRRCRNRGGNRR